MPSRARSSTPRPPRTSRPRHGSGRSAPRSSGRRFTRRSPACSASAQVNLGQYLTGGDAGRSAAVAQSDLRELRRSAAGRRPDARLGRSVRITVGDLGDVAFDGRISAIDSVVDETTRNVTVQATLANPGGKLRPGMFVQTQVAARRKPRRRRAARLRRSTTRRTATRSSSSPT